MSVSPRLCTLWLCAIAPLCACDGASALRGLAETARNDGGAAMLDAGAREPDDGAWADDAGNDASPPGDAAQSDGTDTSLGMDAGDVLDAAPAAEAGADAGDAQAAPLDCATSSSSDDTPPGRCSQRQWDDYRQCLKDACPREVEACTPVCAGGDPCVNLCCHGKCCEGRVAEINCIVNCHSSGFYACTDCQVQRNQCVQAACPIPACTTP